MRRIWKRRFLLAGPACAAFSLCAMASLCPSGARAQAPAPALLDLSQGSLTYTVIHKLHEVKGTTHAVEGKALLVPDGTVKVQVRAKLASFDSGNSNRDEHMREVTHEAVHPYTTVKGTITGLKLPLAEKVTLSLTGVIELNGEKQALTVPVTVAPEGKALRGLFSFPISLEQLKVERPELLFVKVEDRVVIDGDLLFEPAK